MSIELDGVRKAFGPRVILNGITLTVQDGETLAVIGYSGTGKSVLLKTIVRLLEADAGSVHVDGQDVAALRRRDLFALRQPWVCVVPAWRNPTWSTAYTNR
jgi:phospholipid/cholesterol/gamma-HCH transport system ATP-binding protein